MRILNAAMQNLLNSDSLTGLSTFWKVTRKDAVVLGFTDWDQDITYSGVTYKASTGYSRSALQQRVDLAVPNFDVTGILDDSAITDLDIRAGKYDYAQIQVFMAIATDTNFATYGTIDLPGAFLGEIKILDGVYTAEVRGLSYALQQTFIEVFTPSCQAQFCDARCTLSLGSYTDPGTVVTTSDGHENFTCTLGGSAGQVLPSAYIQGVVTWATGNNVGYPGEVQNWQPGISTFTLYYPTPLPIQAGDTFTVSAGCPKTQAACLAYGNLINYRGFFAIPGANFLYDYGEISGG